MFEDSYRSMNEQVNPSDALLIQTIGRAGGTHTFAGQRSLFSRPYFKTATAVLLLLLLISTPVMAARVPALYGLMYQFSPELTQYLVPVQRSCLDNGIRMEVVSASFNGNTAELCVAIQDLTGDRVDETTDLFDSYSIHTPFGNMGHCERIGYDEASKAALFLITLTDWEGRKIEGRKVTFSVREFISHKTALESTEVPIDLTALEEASVTQSVNPTGMDLNAPQDGLDDSAAPDSDRILLPGASIYTPVSHLSVTAAGYVDGSLHIQLQTDEKLTLDPHGYFYLLTPDGKEQPYDYSISFNKLTDDGNRIDYQEFVFHIPQSEISGYRLFGSFYTSGLNTKGNWQVTFPLENDTE